ncbi:MAG: hypothetical protein IKM04_07635 [Clostridia bacterium]|nr:hypothetical protein [Clostridia bacterium]
MSPKELMYIEDALSHEKFLITQYQNAIGKLSDNELKTFAQQQLDRHNQTFNMFLQLL